MATHIDILDQTESLKKPFYASAGLHVAVFAFLIGYGALAGRGKILWGDPNSLGGGGAVGITPVSQIALPSRGGPVNPVANDTESNVPQPPKEETAKKPARAEDPDAIALKSKRFKRKLTDVSASYQRYRSNPNQRNNQLYSSAGQAMSSNMFGGMSGSGGVGVASGSPFGSQYGYYIDLLRQRVSEKWRTQDVDPRLQAAPSVVVSFELQRDGSVSNIRFLQRSGTATLDFSAQRAILEASPFPALPAGYTGRSVTIEFWFQLKR
jgi:protein TonB